MITANTFPNRKQVNNPSQIHSLALFDVALFDVAYWRCNFTFYSIIRSQISNQETPQYKPDAQAREQEILGNLPSLARFEVAVFAFRGKAPFPCLAQPIGLGLRFPRLF